MTPDRRTRPREVPYECTVRLCIVPQNVYRCPNCSRPVFRYDIPVKILPLEKQL